MAPVALLRSQRNDFFHAIARAQLSPIEFEWTERPGADYGFSQRVIPVLTHVASGHYFALANDPFGGRNVKFAPGNKAPSATHYRLPWDDVVDAAERWAGYVAGEVIAPDLWEGAAAAARVLPIGAAQLSNQPFAAPELQRLEESLSAIEAVIQQHQDLTTAQASVLLGAIQQSREAAQRLGRKDWLLLTLGSLVGAFASAAVQPQVATAITRSVSVALQWLAGQSLLPGV